MDRILTKEQFLKVAEPYIKNLHIDVDFTYEVYELSVQAIKSLKDSNIIKSIQPINSLQLIYYIFGEFYYSINNVSE